MTCATLYLGWLVLVIAVILMIVSIVWLVQYYQQKNSSTDNLGTWLSALLLGLFSIFLIGFGLMLVAAGKVGEYVSGARRHMGMGSGYVSPLARA